MAALNQFTTQQTEHKQPTVKTKYFNEYAYLEDWLQLNPQFKMVKYNFTFSYGYCLYYTLKNTDTVNCI